MDHETQLALAALGGLLVPAATTAVVLLVRKRKALRGRLYISLRSDERTDAKPSLEAPPFPKERTDED